MNIEHTLYTGNLKYQNIDCAFIFDRDELRLIPPQNMRNEIGWMTIEGGAKARVHSVPVGVDFLIGNCNETRQKIIFIPKQNATLVHNNSAVIIFLAAYIICEYDRNLIDSVSFSCPEINYIHPINQAITLSIPVDEFLTRGVATVNLQDFDQTTTEKQVFKVDGKEVKVYFGISRVLSTKIHESPIQLESSLTFDFNAINDYKFIYRLWMIAKNFIRFLCYRKNVFIPQVKLSAPSESGKHETFATMYLIDESGEPELEALEKGCFIKQAQISGHEGEILSDIAEDKLYLRHLPETYLAGRHIDEARFVMITAAFEWEFHRFYPNGVKKSDTTIEAEETVSKCIEEHINATSGKQREIYRFLKRRVKTDLLQAKIIQMGKDFSDIIGAFGDNLFRLNGHELKYCEMGKRLADQRNHFAHGDLGKEFIGFSLLDLIFLEYVIYALQLKRFGVNVIEIQKAINDLFHLGFAF